MTTPVFELLRDAMHERYGGSVTRLAEAFDVPVQSASKWLAEDERKRTVPTPASCEKIAVGLSLDPDYVLELAGHRKPRPGRPPVDLVQSELDARLAKLATTLSKYPRVFWLAVVEASERLAEAGDALVSAPPVSDPGEGGVSASDRAPKRGSRGQKPPLAGAYPVAGLATAGV